MARYPSKALRGSLRRLRRDVHHSFKRAVVKLRRYFSLGARGERTARRYLRNLGYHLRHFNWRCRIGELDIVAQDNSTLVFIEVKTRRSHIATDFPPEEAVDRRKRRKLEQLSEHYRKDFFQEIKQRRLRYIRFDIISVTAAKQGDRFHRPTIKHFKG